MMQENFERIIKKMRERERERERERGGGRGRLVTMNYSESNESGGGMREPLLDRGRAGEDEDQDIEGLMQNVVGYEYRTGAGDSSTSNSSHSSPSRSYANGDCEIKEQIRGMKKNSLVRISASVPEENGDYARHSPFSERNSAGQVSLQSPNVPRFSRQTSGAGGAAQRKARRSSSIAFKSIESFKSVISKGKSRGTVALLSFHVVLTAVWATLGACFYCWRLVSLNFFFFGFFPFSSPPVLLEKKSRRSDVY